MPVRELLDRIDHGFTWMLKGKEPRTRRPRNYKLISILALIALIIQSGMLFLALFGPVLPYRVPRGPAEGLDDPHFVKTVEALAGAQLYKASKLEVLTNGEAFYEAELAAIAQARRSINLEAYIFAKGEVAQRFVKAMAERARAGVEVNVIVDGIGSLSQRKGYFKELTDAGGEVQWYHPIRWSTWPRINNRTHRELLIVDGQVGFIGGAGFADYWYRSSDDEPRWRDTMVRVEGDAVTGLQGTFAENWLEASGEILRGYNYFPFPQSASQTTAMVVASSPSAGRSTSARVLFQLLIASAAKSVHITTPYFLPDTSAREELIKAVKRGVDVHIIVPGQHHDHLLTRRSSRRLYGPLLEAGAKIYEYQPAMIHVKSLVVDGVWAVVGSTNFDGRSFGINDEVNLAALDPAFAARIDADFQNDRSQSREITYDQWKRRPYWERAHELLGQMLERQQ